MPRKLQGPESTDAGFEHLRDIWDLTQDPNRSFQEKLDLLFTIETHILNLPYGFISRTETATDTQTIEAAHGSHELLQPGETAPLSESYCRHTLSTADGLFNIADAQAEEWTDDPAYDRFGLESYVGATVEFDGQTYGTFCFASSEPLETPLSTTERRLVDLLSTWVSHELSIQSSLSEYERQTEQVEQLASLVSHDLRNPLSVAQGHVEKLDETIQESLDQINAAHTRMSDILDDMLLLASIDEPVDDPDEIDFRSCVTTTWQLVETGDATLTVDVPEGTVVADETRLRRLLENLFRNAVEHGGSEVAVEVGLRSDGFYVADDGQGIPESERPSVFEPGYSTKSENTGLGLNIVHRIADAHGWDVEVTDSEAGGTRFEVTGVDGSLVATQ